LEDMALPWSAVLRFHQGFDPSGWNREVWPKPIW
jgi:hypothetical protein